LRLCGIGSLMGARLAGSRVLAFGGTLRIRTGAVRLCGSGSAGLAATHQCTHSALLQQTAKRPSTARRRACGVGRAIDGVFCKGPSQTKKQPRKQTSKQTNKQTNKRTNTQTNKQIA
jgi:hypothetical protein